MKTSMARILTTHVGSLPRPPDLIQRLLEPQARPWADRAALDALADVVGSRPPAGST
jgi:methionine synthase II (cobalamin-independent)